MQGILVTWHLGSKFQVKGHALPLFYFAISFLLSASLKEGHLFFVIQDWVYWCYSYILNGKDALT